MIEGDGLVMQKEPNRTTEVESTARSTSGVQTTTKPAGTREWATDDD